MKLFMSLQGREGSDMVAPVLSHCIIISSVDRKRGSRRTKQRSLKETEAPPNSHSGLLSVDWEQNISRLKTLQRRASASFASSKDRLSFTAAHRSHGRFSISTEAT